MSTCMPPLNHILIEAKWYTLPIFYLFLNFEHLVQPKHAKLITNSTIVGVVVPPPPGYTTHRPNEQYFRWKFGRDEILPDAHFWKFGSRVVTFTIAISMTV